MPIPSPFTNQPFVYPNGCSTAAGSRVPRSQWEHFSQYSDAQSILAALQAAPMVDGDGANASPDLPTPLKQPLKISVSQMQIVDGIAAGIDGMFVEDSPLPAHQGNIPENFVTTWQIIGQVIVDGVVFLLQEYVGDLVKRFSVPEGVDYDAQGFSTTLKVLLLQNVSAGTLGTAEATYRA